MSNFNLEHHSPPSAHRSYAIPMPYIPSTRVPTPATSSSATSTTAAEINIEMMTERRSSLELVPATSDPASCVHSTAVVKYSSLTDPTPLSKLAKQTNLNLPPSNWLKDNPCSKGNYKVRWHVNILNTPKIEYSSPLHFYSTIEAAPFLNKLLDN